MLNLILPSPFLISRAAHLKLNGLDGNELRGYADLGFIQGVGWIYWGSPAPLTSLSSLGLGSGYGLPHLQTSSRGPLTDLQYLLLERL